MYWSLLLIQFEHILLAIDSGGHFVLQDAAFMCFSRKCNVVDLMFFQIEALLLSPLWVWLIICKHIKTEIISIIPTEKQIFNLAHSHSTKKHVSLYWWTYFSICTELFGDKSVIVSIIGKLPIILLLCFKPKHMWEIDVSTNPLEIIMLYNNYDNKMTQRFSLRICATFHLAWNALILSRNWHWNWIQA